MQTLSGLDAAFLALETPTGHLHVTGVLVFDPATMPGGYSFEKGKRFVAGRLHCLPTFRSRLVRVPFNVGRPVWVDDPGFDLDYHVRRAALPPPGGVDELATFAADLAGRPLDRSKPLWEMWFVEGVEGGNVAVVAKMHHATIDGVSGANLLANLLDLEPVPLDDAPPEDDWHPERVPSDVELVARALAGRAARRLRLVRTAATATRVLAGLVGRRLLGRGGRMATPFTAPPTRFNEPITAHRRIALAAVPLATVKKVKAAFGVTVNDVVLAVCGGALRRYLVSHSELPERPLVAAVPVSVRGGDTENASANQVSGMMVSLATDVADPVERLRVVTEAARGAKDEHETFGRDFVPDLGEFAASELFGLGARFYSRFHLAAVHPPAVNLVMSNIPGPDFPLYFAGARLLALYPLGPVYDGVGLNITVLSYLDRVGFGFVAGAELAPDLADLAAAVDESLQELEKEADAPPRVAWRSG